MVKNLKNSCIDKIKRIKTICQRHYQITKNEIKIKLIKLGKQPGTKYYLECKDFTHNFRPQEVKMTNKVLREKSNCVVCRSNKSRFLKQKHNNKK